MTTLQLSPFSHQTSPKVVIGQPACFLMLAPTTTTIFSTVIDTGSRHLHQSLSTNINHFAITFPIVHRTIWSLLTEARVKNLHKLQESRAKIWKDLISNKLQPSPQSRLYMQTYVNIARGKAVQTQITHASYRKIIKFPTERTSH